MVDYGHEVSVARSRGKIHARGATPPKAQKLLKKAECPLNKPAKEV
jgi:hypothetical protein